jgi:hypothetical protein
VIPMGLGALVLRGDSGAQLKALQRIHATIAGNHGVASGKHRPGARLLNSISSPLPPFANLVLGRHLPAPYRSCD